MEVKIQHWAIKKYCGEVKEHSVRMCGFGGHQYGSRIVKKCGFYSNKACNENNCPIYNQKKGYEERTSDIGKKLIESGDWKVSTMKPV